MLDSLHIQNFRCFEDLTIPTLGRVNLIVGKNNSGKSTLLEAIQVYSKPSDQTVIHQILAQRGDDSLDSSVTKLFHNEQLPKDFSDRLEIGDGKKNLYFLTPDFLFDEDKILLLKKSLPTLFIPNNYETIKVSGDLYMAVIAIRNGQFNLNQVKAQYCQPHAPDENILAKMWDQVFLNTDDSIIKETLQLIEKNITNIAFIPKTTIDSGETKNSTQRIAVVKIKGKNKAVPIKNLGDGMSRLLQIFLNALQAQNGFLLLDEFENGLHYSIQEEIWEKLFKLAKELDIQVFATTHSQDTIKAFSKVALANKAVEGQLISLGRSAYGDDKGRIIAVIHDEDDLKYILETGMEVR